LTHGAGRFSAAASAADVALAGLVLLSLGLMIVPPPTWMLDLLISANLSAAVAILLVVLYVPEAIGIATFPTLLLLSTLFRLSLNVAATRLILLQADAGEIVRAFGAFVVRGSYVVGAVVFCVLAIVQFVVVAKGSERVAEVAARFALDALPGRQMAIDAELRSGAIDGHEARRRRRQLQRESQFYGAMDGGMKFVKGDAVASLVILVVDVVGGLVIGVGAKGMGVADALRRYGLLTIGEGLVTQIPALVLSTAAGVLVTRVASEEADVPLGAELARQLLAAPRALQAAAVFVLLLAVVPGLPAAPFLVTGALLLFVARTRARAQRREERRAIAEPTPRPGPRGAREPAFVPVVVPWSIDVSEDLEHLVESETAGLQAMTFGLREAFFAELGVPLPPPRSSVRAGLGTRTVVVSLHEVPARTLRPPAGLEADAIAAWVRAETLDALRERAADFIGLAEVQQLLDDLEPFAPATVRNVVPRPVSLALLTDVLRRLVEERLSVRDLRGVLEALAPLAPTEKDPLALAEHVRAQMRRAITFRLTAGRPRLDVVVLDPLLEDTVRGAITRTAAGSFLALPPQAARDVIASVRAALSTAGHASPVVLTQPDIRRFVRTLLQPELPGVWVASFAELLPEISLRPLARATPEGPPLDTGPQYGAMR
jgi:type III secretion protein V